MNYYKSISGEVFAYDDQQVLMGLADDKTLMTPEEVMLHINPPKTEAQILQEQQFEARQYLIDTDWYVIRFTETGVAIPVAVTDKRAYSRSIL